jgi:osmotically-inducible protein OsmY
MVAAAAALIAIVSGAERSLAMADTASEIRRALQRLPYYGVFDFLAFSVDRGTVTLSGYAYRGNLAREAEAAVKRMAGVDEVANRIEELPASQNDDRIRWATFYRIYTDDFLSRYAPGGPMAARYDAMQFARFPGLQPLGVYPIHIVVNGGRTTLLGVVDSASDKTMVGFRAREVGQVFSVENELMVEKSGR